MFPIINKSTNCTDCYRCLRACAVKAISFSNKQAKIIADKCVLCARCIAECPAKTKTIYDQTAQVKKFLQEDAVVLTLSPSFISYFGCDQAEDIYAAAYALGFILVEETAVSGAGYIESLTEQINDKEQFIISSHCPVIVNLLEKRFPKLLPHLLPLATPATYHAHVVRKRFEQPIKIVHATACLSEMHDDQSVQEIDAMLSFAQLEQLLKEANVEAMEKFRAKEPTYRLSGQELILTGGLAEQLVDKGVFTNEEVIHLSGIKDCLETLEGLDKKLVKGIKFLEMMTCREGCITGLNLEKNDSILNKRLQVLKREKRYAHLPALESVETYQRSFHNKWYQPKEAPTEAVKEVLQSLGQFNRYKLLNCSACGYDSCYEKAVAVVRGDAEQEMCMTYMRHRAESRAHTIVRSIPSAIIVFDQDFMIQEANPSACQMFAPYGLQEGNALFEYIDIRYMERVVATGMGIRDKIVHYADLDLWTRQIIVRMYDTKNLYMAIFEDITEQEKKRLELETMKQETLEKANQVINNQMMVAQQIAGLLGETTAETKITLLNLIKQFEREKELE